MAVIATALTTPRLLPYSLLSPSVSTRSPVRAVRWRQLVSACHRRRLHHSHRERRAWLPLRVPLPGCVSLNMQQTPSRRVLGRTIQATDGEPLERGLRVNPMPIASHDSHRFLCQLTHYDCRSRDHSSVQRDPLVEADPPSAATISLLPSPSRGARIDTHPAIQVDVTDVSTEFASPRSRQSVASAVDALTSTAMSETTQEPHDSSVCWSACNDECICRVFL